MRPILIVLLLGISVSVFAQQSKTYTLYFDFNKDQLTSQASNELELLLSDILMFDDYSIKIEAHTDDKGSQSYNHQLAQRRARTVKIFLEKKGLNITNADVLNFGEDRPAYNNEEEQGRQLNRRVDVILNTVPLESLEDLMAKLRNDQQQKFTIDPSQSQQITAENGTTVWIPAAAFQFKDGSQPRGPIDIIIEEHYNKSQMVANELSTHSDGQMLETGGMIYISAESGGKELDIKQGMSLTLGMPTPNQLEGMQLFNAQTNAEGRPTNWEPTGQDFAKSQKEALLLPPQPKYPVYVHWRIPYSRNWKAAPKHPGKIGVYPYRAPKKPLLENVQYNPPFLKKLFLSKEKIAAKKKEIFDAQMVRYHKNMINFEKRQIAYEKAKIDYDQKMENFLWQYGTWEGMELEDSLEISRMHNKLENQLRKRVLDKYQTRHAQWVAKKDSILTAYYDAQRERGELSMEGLSYYFYRIDNPGWINCDRFYNVPQAEKMDLAINDTDLEEEKVFVVYKNINSMMRLHFKRGGQYIQNDLPINEEVKIIGLKVINGQPSMAVMDTKIGEKPVIDLDYEKCRIQDIKEVMQSI